MTRKRIRVKCFEYKYYLYLSKINLGIIWKIVNLNNLVS